MTNVITFLAGPGCGKSTTSAGLFYHMKLQGLDVELVPEWAKKFAWQKTPITPLQQSFLFGKQAQSEACLYNKLDYLVVDSSVLLSPAYELFYSGKSMVLTSVLEFLKHAKSEGVEHHHFLLNRVKPYNTKGRYETEEQAKKFDVFLRECLNTWEIPYTVIDGEDSGRVAKVMKQLNLEPPCESCGHKPSNEVHACTGIVYSASVYNYPMETIVLNSTHGYTFDCVNCNNTLKENDASMCTDCWKFK